MRRSFNNLNELITNNKNPFKDVQINQSSRPFRPDQLNKK
jgi:hypothetical protein